MGDRGSKLAHAAEAPEPSNRILVQTQLQLRATMLRDEDAGHQASQGEHEHECLERGDVDLLPGKELHAQYQAELRQKDTERYDLEPRADRHPDDRQEEDIEQLEMMLFRVSEHEGKCGDDGDELGSTLAREFRNAPACQKNQGE